MSMLRIASLVLEYGGLLKSEVSICLSIPLLLLFSLCVSCAASFLGLLWFVVGGVLSARLMASNRGVDEMVWLGPTDSSSCDDDN